MSTTFRFKKNFILLFTGLALLGMAANEVAAVELVITAQPASAVVLMGAAVSLSVDISGTEPFGYQWLKDGVMLQGQTNRAISFSSFRFTDSGSYKVVVTNVFGLAISLPASLSTPNAPLRAWGYNGYGQLGDGTRTETNRPITVASNVVAVAGGDRHSLFVKADGTLWGMGSGSHGRLGDGTNTSAYWPVQVASNVVAVAGGESHSLFVKTDGTLWGMGYNGSGQLGDGTTTSAYWPVQVASNVVAVAGGESHSLFVKTDGTLWGMGSNIYGQLCDGTNTATNQFVQMATNVVAVAGGARHSLFVKADGTLWSMGSNDSGQLGNGTNTFTHGPVQVASNVVAVAGGGSHSLFVKADGTLWGMGLNSAGQLGDGTNTSTNRPVQVASNVVAVAGGISYSLFVKADGTMWGMGMNHYGQLGDGTKTPTNRPVLVNKDGLLTASLAIGSKASYSLAIAGALPMAVVSNQTFTAGQTVIFTSSITSGDGPFTYQWQFNGTNIVDATNASYTINGATWDNRGIYAVVVSGTYGSTTSTVATLTMSQTISFPAIGDKQMTDTVGLFATASSGLPVTFTTNGGPAVITDGTNLSFTGAGIVSIVASQAGDANWSAASVTNTFNATAIIHFSSQPVSAVVTAGQVASLNVSNSGVGPFGYQWLKDGVILQGQTNSTISFSSFRFTDSGSYNVVVTNAFGITISLPAILSTPNAPLRVWGRNNYGQLGNGTKIDTNRPVTVASNVVAVAGGGSHSLFVKADGTLWGMGYNGYGQLGNGTTNNTNRPVQIETNVVAVASGDDHSLFLKSDGTLWSVGANKYGQLINGTTNDTTRPIQVASNVVSVAGGGAHSLFVKADGTLWGNSYGLIPLDGDSNRPVQMASNVVSVSAGAYHCLFVKVDGTLWGMGNNYYGQLGKTGIMFFPPVQIASNVVAIAGGGSHSLFVKTNGTLWVMGKNNYGQLGDGTNTATNRPIQVATTVVAVACGTSHSLFVKADGKLWGMGDNVSGQLGNGTTTSTNRPVLVNKDGLLIAGVAKGSSASHSLAIAGALPMVVVSNQTFTVGQPVSFTASITSGDGPFTYQWQFNGTNIVDATNASHTIARAALSNIGDYAVVVAGTYGSTTSTVATLTMSQTIMFPAIGDQLMTDTVGLSATATSGLTVSFKTNSGPVVITDGTNLSFTGTGVVSIVASQAGDTNWSAAPDVTNTFNVIESPAFSLSAIYQNIDGIDAFLIEFWAMPGKTYYIQYASSLTNEWETVQPKIVAPVNRIQWIDSGPPVTESAPGSVPTRFYRVIETEE